MLSYARVRFTVAVGWFTVANGGITVVEGGCIVGLLDPYMSYRILSYARTRVRVRFTVVEGGSLLLIKDALWLSEDP